MASPRRAALRRSGDESAAASAMLSTFLYRAGLVSTAVLYNATRCVLSGSCPQLLDVTLRASQHPVDHVRVGVGCYLGRDPGASPTRRVVASVSPRPNTLLRLEMAISTRCLSPLRRSDGSVTRRMSTSAKASFNLSLR